VREKKLEKEGQEKRKGEQGLEIKKKTKPDTMGGEQRAGGRNSAEGFLRTKKCQNRQMIGRSRWVKRGEQHCFEWAGKRKRKMRGGGSPKKKKDCVLIPGFAKVGGEFLSYLIIRQQKELRKKGLISTKPSVVLKRGRLNNMPVIGEGRALGK